MNCDIRLKIKESLTVLIIGINEIRSRVNELVMDSNVN